MAVIELHDLTKRFGGLVAVDHLGFEVESGQVVGFLGPNGAGKTTTLRMLLGLATPTEGSATINGRRYQELDQPLHVVGAVLDASEAHPGRTARNHLRIQALLGEVSPSRIDEMLDLVDLASAADRRVGEFSLGMRQRLGLATALLTEPEILILDEPANGLDPEGVHWLRQLLRDLAAEGRTVLVSSHVLGEVAHIADSVVILDRGRLVTHSTLGELTAGSAQVVRIRTPNAGELRLALEAEGAHVQPVASDRLEVSGASPEQIGNLAAKRSIPIFGSVTETSDLEDIFLNLTSHTGSIEARQ
ncbi:MAG: ATP-binding cassette domain-containing protein [Streptosporangiaceae bacterium]|jgi:ABC-2 type transport system ATP-binding protein